MECDNMECDNDMPIALNRIVSGNVDILQLIVCKQGRITTIQLDDERVEWMFDYLQRYRQEKGKTDATK